jgi:hypothetical protein
LAFPGGERGALELAHALRYAGECAITRGEDSSIDLPPILPARTARLFYPLLIAYVPALASVLQAIAR